MPDANELDLEELLAVPYLTADLPGVGGVIRQSPEDFVVEEIPLYELEGEGEHLYLWIEKRSVASGELIDRLASHFGVNRRDIGYAGRKDKHAVTRQWVSLPIRDSKLQTPEEFVGVRIELDEEAYIEVLDARLHRNKLKTGHLEGNRFELVIRDTEGAAERVPPILEKLADLGVPYIFGPQRFGNNRSTFWMGYHWITTGEKPGPIRKNKRLRRLAVNAVQSAIFNRTVSKRLTSNTFDRAILGDVLELFEGGLFRVKPDEIDEGQALVSSRKATPTGPLWGERVLRAEDRADELEVSCLDEFDLDPSSFDIVSREASGLRRAFTVRPGELEFDTGVAATDAVRIGFSLPSGAYATVVLREIMKNENFDGSD